MLTYQESLLKEISFYLKHKSSFIEIISANPVYYTYLFFFVGIFLGDHKSILQSQKVELSGLASWVAWRAAYFTRLGSLVNKVQVPYDWYVEKFYP